MKLLRLCVILVPSFKTKFFFLSLSYLLKCCSLFDGWLFWSYNSQKLQNKIHPHYAQKRNIFSSYRGFVGVKILNFSQIFHPDSVWQILIFKILPPREGWEQKLITHQSNEFCIINGNIILQNAFKCCKWMEKVEY